MSDADKSISVIICAYTEERWEDIGAAVASLRAQTVKPDEIILVVDHNPGLLDRVRMHLPDVVAIENSHARGLSGARNSGIAVACGELIAFLDDDAVAAPDWIAWLTAWFDDPQVIGVGGAVDPLWATSRPTWFPEEYDWIVGCTYRGLPTAAASVRNPFGGCCCLRHEAFSIVGGFREGIGRVGKRPLGCEDTELCIRVRQHWPDTLFIHEPLARITHRVPETRARWHYFISRCYAEGLSKAHVSQLVGAQDSLATERSYILRTLSRGVAREIATGIARLNRDNLARAAAIIIGLIVTVAGYINGMIANRFTVSKGETAARVSCDGENAPQRRRVLMVAARYLPLMGGIETHVHEVSQRLAHEGFAVTVLTTDPSGQLPAVERVNDVEIRRVRAYPAKRDYYFAPGIYRIITRGDWDLIHCQGFHTLVPPLAMFAAWRAGIPYVITSHTGGHSSRLRNTARTVQWMLLRPLLAHARKIVVVSNFEAEHFRKRLHLPEERFIVIRNGSYLPVISALADTAHKNSPLILSVGRLERYKGHHRIISALPKVLEQRPGTRLQILGTGPYEQTLRQLASNLEVAEYVDIRAVPPSDRQQMASLLSRADLVTLLSDYEAHPVSVMEALALRRPVLVADTSGLSELADGRTVRAISPESTPAEIATAVLLQLDSPLSMTEVHLPTWDDCTSELLSVYRSIGRTPCAS